MSSFFNRCFRLLNHKHFWPLYKKAAQLDLPICIHIGNARPFVVFSVLKRYLDRRG